MNEQGYYRFPTLYRDTVVFVCEDDLWITSSAGGRAFRLTAGVSEASHPRFSPDGTQIAFVGREDGVPDVYVIPSDGGVCKRLTFEASLSCVVVGFSSKEEVVYSSDVKSAFRKDTWLYKVSIDGGYPRKLPYGSASTICYGNEGGMLLGRYTADPARWKRYRGGTSGELWIDETGDGEFRRLLGKLGNIANPCWLGNRIYFISDYEGIGNIYSCTPQGEDLKPHTEHQEFYARNLSSDGMRLIYHAGANLFLFDPATSQNKPIEIQLISSRTQRRRKFVSAPQFLQSASLSPDGASLAIISRGKAYTLPNWEGPVLQYGHQDGVRYRLLRWLEENRRLVAIQSDETEKERLVVFSCKEQEAPQIFEDLELGRVLSLHVSPRGYQIALSNHKNELLFIDLAREKAQVIVVDKSSFQRIGGFAWSADGRWLAYGFADSAQTMAIKLYHVESKESFFATRPLLQDCMPAFDPEGRYLYFLGKRDFTPIYDELQFDLGFPKATRPFAIVLRKDLSSPFISDPKAPEEKDNTKKTKESLKWDALSPVEIDKEGIEERVVAFPVPEGKYGRILGLRDKVLFSTFPVEGFKVRNWSSTAKSKNGTIKLYDFKTQQQKQLIQGITDFSIGRDHKTLLYQAGERLRVLPAGESPPKLSPAESKQANQRSGWVRLHRVKVSVCPENEWRQMFREAWRLQKEQFWSEDMSGVDWDAVYERYLPLVSRVTTRAELSDLLWEMQGELGTSHAYEAGGDYRKGPRYRQGFLGVDWEQDHKTGEFRATHIVSGDSWEPSATSPLRAPGIDFRVGDTLLAINGVAIGKNLSPEEALVNQAGNEVSVLIQRGKDKPKTYRVKTLSDERMARYREWVNQQQKTVHQETKGRVGYIHIPNMGPWGYSEFHRSFLVEFDREALIIDVRFNGGGHVSSLLLQKLARRRLGYVYPRWSAPRPYVNESPRGPLVAITNELAGSDGDIFSHVFKQMKLGPLLGKRTWGGVVGIWPRHHLVDHTMTTQPEFAYCFDDAGWQVENYGTDPDIEVDYPPQDYMQDIDPQLERSIKTVLELLENNPAHSPKQFDKPMRTLPEVDTKNKE